MSIYPTVRPSFTLDFQKSKQLDPRISFSRSSSATYVEGGVIKYADEHQARFEKEGLLMEESRTNKLTSSLFSSGWREQGAVTGSITELAPDGSNTAVEITGIEGPGSKAIYVSSNQNDTGKNTFSYYAKATLPGTGQTAYINYYAGGATNTVNPYIDLDTGEPTSGGTTGDGTFSTIYSGNGWWRICATLTPTGDHNFKWSAGCVSGQTILIWGAQLETGTFPTSYIPTTSSAVTRAADVAQITGDNFSIWYNQSEGTLYYQYNAIGGGQFLSPASIRVDNSQDGQSWGYWMYSGGGQSKSPQAGLRNPKTSVALADGNPSASTIMGQSYKVAVGIDNSTLSARLEGYSVQSRTITSLPTMTQLSLGLIKNSWNNKYTGHISRLSYYPRRLTDLQLETLTL